MKRGFLLLAIFLSIHLSAQNPGVTSLIEQYAPTPKALEQTRHGDVSVDGGSGVASLEIPIGAYQDHDFNIPISLQYSFDGLKPASPSGEAGLGWSLSAGGSITREIVGLDDFVTEGYKASSSHPSSSNIYSMARTITTMDGGYPSFDGTHETTSDIYHFTFPGHSGSFIIDNSGNFVTYGTSGERGTYDISYVNDCFIIRTSDGMTWQFGDNASEPSRERMLRQNGIFDTYAQTVPLADRPIVTWNLSVITAPDGRKAEFSYISNRTYNSIPSQNYDDVLTTFGRGINSNGQTDRYKFASLVCTSYLTSIKIKEAGGAEKTVASFTWERKSYKEIDDTQQELDCYKKMIVQTRRLTGVTLSEGSTVLRTATLTYNDSRNRPLLTSLTIPVFGTWAFEYNLPSGAAKLPGQLSNAVDLWGYYNGNTSILETDINPMYVNPITLDEALDTTAMDPNAAYSVLGSLKKVSWPTGGSTSISYEGHQASRIVLRKAYHPVPEGVVDSLGFTTSLYPVSEMLHNSYCGGVRVKTITDNSITGGSFVRSYAYTDSLGTSTGIIQEFNRYLTRWVGLDPNGDNIYEKNPNLRYPGNGFDKRHIAYSSVLETLSDGSSIRTDYTSWVDNPDGYSHVKKKVLSDFDTFGYGAAYDHFINNILREPDSRAYRRGLPLRKTIYDPSGDIVRRESYTYTELGDSYAAYIIGSGIYWWSARRFICDMVLSSAETVYYPSGGGALVNTQTITYDSYGRVASTTDTDSDGTIHSVEYTYLSGTLQPSLVSNLTRKTRPFMDPTTYTVESTAYTYSHEGDLWNLTGEVRTLYDVLENGTVADNTAYSEYDSYGHPRQISFNGDTTAILWGHNGRYPVATIRNSSFSSLPSLLRTTFDGNLNATAIKTVYELTGKESHVYDWQPSVGMTREIGPSGRSISYQYDTLGRLAALRDARDTLLNGFSYGTTPYSRLGDILLRHVETTTNTGSALRVERAVYDGLGRDWLNIIEACGTVNPTPISSYLELDGLDRRTKAYLPFASALPELSLILASQRGYWGAQYGSDESVYANMVTTYEGGPLALPVSERLPGKVMSTADRKTTVARDVNSAGEVPRIRYYDSGGYIVVNGTYPAGTLLKTTTSSPDGEQVISFTTALGREVLSRTVSGTQKYDTYTVRDRFDHAVWVITPLLGETIRNAAAGTPISLTRSANNVLQSCYLFTYDDRGDLIKTVRPGSGYEIVTYDVAHRVDTSTPATSIQTDSKFFVKNIYDALGRIKASILYRKVLLPGFRDNPTPVPISSPLDTLVSYTYGQSSSVDCINNDTPGTPYSVIPAELAFSARSGIILAADLHVTGELIMESQKPIQDAMNQTFDLHFDDWITGDGMLGSTPVRKAYYYDSHGNVAQTVTSWPDGALSRLSRSYDLEGRVLASLEEHRLSGNSSSDWIWTENDYDSRGNLLSTNVWIGNSSLPAKTDATETQSIAYTYDGIGRLTSKSTTAGGNTLTETIASTMQGWTSALSYSLDTTMVFSESLNYWAPAHNGVAARYGGAVSEATSTHGGHLPFTMGYSYDGFGRLSGSVSFLGSSPYSDDMNTEDNISYDVMGNITGLIRRDAVGSAAAILSMTRTGNQLTGVSDAVSGTSWSNTFNSDGSLLHDGRTDRYYADNLLGRVAKVHAPNVFPFGGAYMTLASYTYLPDGTKIEVVNNAVRHQYRGSFIYLKTGQTLSLETVATPAGMLSVSGNNRTPYSFASDHLGNVRAVVDMSDGIVVERNDYYPYGTRITVALDSTSTNYPALSANRWRLQGKEEQYSVTGLPFTDFGARQYDPFTGSWLAPDPLASDYPSLSPYSFCAANPINYVDPDGETIVISYMDSDGNECQITYSVGMSYSGDNSFVADVIMALNQMNEVGGSFVVNTLSESPNIYYYSQGLSGEGSIGYNSNGCGGTILFGDLSSAKDTFSGFLEGVAHESFHAIQDIEGQGGVSIFNEVEAYAYSYIITNNWLLLDRFTTPQSVLQSNKGVDTSCGNKYEKAFNSLIQSRSFPQEDMATAIRCFKDGSYINSSSSLYSNFPIMGGKKSISVLKKYYPITR